MTQLRDRVLELALNNGLRDTAIVTALKDEFPNLTRHRVRVIFGEGAKQELLAPPAAEMVYFGLPDDLPPIYTLPTHTDTGRPLAEDEVIERAADHYEVMDRSVQQGFWYLGGVVASLQSGYGQGAVKRLAERVGKSPERLYQLARTHRVFQGQKISPELTFSHYQIAAESDKPEYWVRYALEHSLSARKLTDEVKGKQLPEFRLHETPPEVVKPVTETGYSDFPPAEKPPPPIKDPFGVPYNRDELDPDGQAEWDRRHGIAERNEKADWEFAGEQVSLQRWYSYIRSFNCLRCGASDVEIAHIEAVLSARTNGWLPRRTGLAEWATLPLCRSCHQTARDSIHSVGEDEFFDSLRSVKWAHDWLITRLLEFFTG